MLHSTRGFLAILCTWLLILSAPVVAQQGGGAFIRADANTDGLIDIADPLYVIGYLFDSGPSLCRDAMDANDDGGIDVADVVYPLTFLFASGQEPPAPFDWCGYDPTPDALDCDRNLTCDIGGPIAGLSDDELRSFNAGRQLMLHDFTPTEGLGPLFNSVSCTACHGVPTVGGSSPLYRNFFLMGIGQPGSQTSADYLPSLVLPLVDITDHRFDNPRPVIQPSTPGMPVTLAHRNAPPMFGTGLFEFVSNATIVGNADADDVLVPDGISGRFNSSAGNIGRFGYKLQSNFVEPFVRGAAVNQMGITTDALDGSAGVVSLALQDPPSDLDAPIVDDDGVPDPEMPVDDLLDLITFCRFLAPIQPRPFGPDEFAGEALFETIGCDKCHIPSLESSRGPVNAYTDLLLHDIGNGDGIAMGVPQYSTLDAYTDGEFRTAPLWGISYHAPFLHDGAADTLEQAILMHGGEAEAITQAFIALDPDNRAKLIAFLEAL